MDESLNKALAQALGASASRETPARQRGTVTVEVDELARVVRRIVEERSTGPAGEDAASAFDREARIAAALDGYARLQLLRERLSEHRAQVEDELSRVRGALVARRGFAEELARPGAWPVDAERWHALRLRVHARIAAFAEAKGMDGPPDRVVAADLLDLFAKERAWSLAELRRQADFEIAQLERRLSQLVTTLEETDEIVASLVDAPAVDAGVASAYRGAQGIESDARYRERKSAMLDQVFRANLHLQRERKGSSTGAGKR